MLIIIIRQLLIIIKIVIRDRPQDPLTSNECHMENVPGSDDVFHMTVTDLRGCGVETCGDVS